MSKGLEALEKLYKYPNLKYRNEIVYLLEQDNLPIYREIIEKELKALEIIKELFKIRIGVDESENDKNCGIVFLVADKDHIWEIYHTFDEENIQKLKLLKEVLL